MQRRPAPMLVSTSLDSPPRKYVAQPRAPPKLAWQALPSEEKFRQGKIDELVSTVESALEEHGMDAFATMPMERQQKMASAFAGLKDGLSRAFAELQERNGPDYAITSEDIAEIMQKMRR